MLNVHPEKTVYKHLVPVNVNDSVLDVKPSPVRRQAKSKTYVQMSKDPEPILNRYLQPTPRLVHHLTLDDVDDDDDIGSNNRASINKRADNQFKRMHEFYAQYLSPTSAKMYSDSRWIRTTHPTTHQLVLRGDERHKLPGHLEIYTHENWNEIDAVVHAFVLYIFVFTRNCFRIFIICYQLNANYMVNVNLCVND